MPLKKHGVGDVLPEEEDLQKTSTQADKDKALAEVKEESEKVDKK